MTSLRVAIYASLLVLVAGADRFPSGLALTVLLGAMGIWAFVMAVR